MNIFFTAWQARHSLMRFDQGGKFLLSLQVDFFSWETWSAHYNFCLQKWTYFLLLDKQDIVLCALIKEVSFFSRYRNCPVYDQECFKCKRKNHFATLKICKGKRKEQDFNEWFDIGRETIHANLRLNGKSIKFMLDSRATVNVIPVTFVKDNKMEHLLKKGKQLDVSVYEGKKG